MPRAVSRESLEVGDDLVDALVGDSCGSPRASDTGEHFSGQPGATTA